MQKLYFRVSTSLFFCLFFFKEPRFSPNIFSSCVQTHTWPWTGPASTVFSGPANVDSSNSCDKAH